MAKPELVAAAFRSRNAEKLRREELVQELAFSLHLMTPTAAADAIEAALASGLLEPAGERLRLVEEGIAPADEAAPADDAPDLFHRVVAAVMEATGDSQREVIRKVNRGQKAHYGIRPATEALLLAADAGVDVAPFLDEAQQGLAQRARD
ncbi:MAG: hypothetical protein BEU05_03230 [Marine Group III euryarchaeote CG-Bathy2]|uniref:Uncharacterized protein n=2 Tax=Methanobacteriati TaxID=3366610 RepID=A0A075GMR7_9EURY|nr:hypothetical protein [uncultured marine group II/III euryarchaeote KM3_181_H05]OIR12290.1 MAG: hypothetical protein BEU05_03230 [Marine Group III euryarchaeote CG-Bathy2]